MSEQYENKLYLPPWLVSCLTKPWTKESNKDKSYRVSCEHWNSYQLKGLALLIDSLQQQILSHMDLSSYKLERSSFERTLDSHLLKRLSLDSLFSDLGGLRLFYQEKEQQIAQSIFSCESSLGSSISFDLGTFEQEFILGIFSCYDKWIEEKSDPRRHLGSLPEPLTLDRSLFLDMKKKQTGVVLELLQSSQWKKELVQLPQTFALDLSSLLQIGTGLSKKHHSLVKELKMINRVVRQMNFHGQSQTFTENSPLFCEDKKQTQIIWQTGSHSKQDLSLAYKERVSSFFAYRALFKNKKSLIKQLATGLPKEEISLFEKKFLERIKSDYKFFTKDFIKDKKGSLLPCLLSFLEFSLRSISGNNNPLSGKVRTYFCLQSLKRLDIKSEYQKFIQLLTQNSSFKTLVDENSIFFSQRKDEAQQTPQAEIAPTFSSSQNYSTQIPKEKTVIPPSPTHETPSKEASMSLLKNKEIINQRIIDIRSESQEQYRKIKDLYYDSLNNNSRTTISSLEKRMRQDLFDQQIQQHLVQYLVEQNNSSEVKKILYS